MSGDLRSLHRDLVATIDELEALTAAPAYDETVLSSVRYRMSRLSGARQQLVAVMLAEREREGALSAELRDLKQHIATNRARSTTHIAQWSLREIARDWRGYCDASRGVRAAMRAQIEREKILYHPLGMRLIEPAS